MSFEASQRTVRSTAFARLIARHSSGVAVSEGNDSESVGAIEHIVNETLSKRSSARLRWYEGTKS